MFCEFFKYLEAMDSHRPAMSFCTAQQNNNQHMDTFANRFKSSAVLSLFKLYLLNDVNLTNYIDCLYKMQGSYYNEIRTILTVSGKPRRGKQFAHELL